MCRTKDFKLRIRKIQKHDSLRERVFKRDAMKCEFCAMVSVDWTMDHIVAKCLGGADAMKNLRTLCNGCHERLNKMSAWLSHVSACAWLTIWNEREFAGLVMLYEMNHDQ